MMFVCNRTFRGLANYYRKDHQEHDDNDDDKDVEEVGRRML